MLAAFRESLSESFNSSGSLNETVRTFTRRDWQPVAELFAMRLPEFDAVYALPGAEVLARELSRSRGVPNISLRPGWPGTPGEVLLLTAQLHSGAAEEQAVAQARQAGWTAVLVAAAVEYTSLGGRARLARHAAEVRAAAQVAHTPWGFIFERRSPARWNH